MNYDYWEQIDKDDLLCEFMVNEGITLEVAENLLDECIKFGDIRVGNDGFFYRRQ